MFPLKPILCNLPNKISWSTESNAFFKSKKMQTKYSRDFKDVKIFAIKSKIASVVLESALKPYCLPDSNLFTQMNYTILT